MTTPVCPASWDDFPGLRHADEVMTAHVGSPAVAVQSATHGAYLIGGPLPGVDRGPDPGSVTG